MKSASLLLTALLAAGCHVILPLDGTRSDAPGRSDLDAGPTDGPAPDAPAADLPVGADMHRSWQQVFSQDAGTSGPGRLHSPAAVYHQTSGAVWLYGGTDETGSTSDELWEYRSASGWSQLCGGSMPACGPGPLSGHVMVYDSKHDRVLLHGGVRNVKVGEPGKTELWVWQSGAVTATPGPPGPGRVEAFAAFDQARGVMVLFGGLTKQTFNKTYVTGDLYELAGSQWTGPLTPTLAPSPRSSYVHSMTYVPDAPWTNPTAGRTVLCGGTRYDGSPWQVSDDCWAWDGATWHKLCEPCTGTARMAAGLTYDRLARRLLMVGGFDGSDGGELAGTWASADGASWTLVDPLPTGRDTMALVYDTGQDQVLLHGGNGTPCSDGITSPSYHQNCGDTLLYVAGP